MLKLVLTICLLTSATVTRESCLRFEHPREFADSASCFAAVPELFAMAWPEIKGRRYWRLILRDDCRPAVPPS